MWRIGLPRRWQSWALVWGGPPLRPSECPGHLRCPPRPQRPYRPRRLPVDTPATRGQRFGETALWPVICKLSASPRRQCFATRTAALCPSGGALRPGLHIFRSAPDVEPSPSAKWKCCCPGAIPLGPASSAHAPSADSVPGRFASDSVGFARHSRACSASRAPGPRAFHFVSGPRCGSVRRAPHPQSPSLRAPLPPPQPSGCIIRSGCTAYIPSSLARGFRKNLSIFALGRDSSQLVSI